MITIRQIRAARALLGWEQRELADRAGISLTSLSRIERSPGHDARMSTMEKIRATLTAAGIAFVNRDDGVIGVLIRPASGENATDGS
jgi:transcriptional regulator with XRE-family HTH domain